jgi:hypothetical protein
MDKFSSKIDKILKNKNLSLLMELLNKQSIFNKIHPKLSDKKLEWQEMQEVNFSNPQAILLSKKNFSNNN